MSNDTALYREVEAALAGSPAVHAISTAWKSFGALRPAKGNRIVVVDDEGYAEALDAVQTLRARERDTPIVYVAARHSIELEREVRRVGVSYYADKAARDRNAVLAIEAILRAKGAQIGTEQRGQAGEAGEVQPGSGAREEGKECAS